MAPDPGTGTVFSVRPCNLSAEEMVLVGWESVLSASGFNYLCTEKRLSEDKENGRAEMGAD